MAKAQKAKPAFLIDLSHILRIRNLVGLESEALGKLRIKGFIPQPCDAGSKSLILPAGCCELKERRQPRLRLPYPEKFISDERAQRVKEFFANHFADRVIVL